MNRPELCLRLPDLFVGLRRKRLGEAPQRRLLLENFPVLLFRIRNDDKGAPVGVVDKVVLDKGFQVAGMGIHPGLELIEGVPEAKGALRLGTVDPPAQEPAHHP